MSNPYFQFKKFTIRQDRCAMKVCTDACLFGAWLPARVAPTARVLDIGSGTGLLMLMLAQKHSGRIEGIELDHGAFGQLQENIAGSPWVERLRVFEGDVRQFVFPGKYGLIITNPPFFEDDLPAATGAKNLARHSQALKLAELITAIDANLEVSGSFDILLPYQRTKYFESLASGRGFHLQEQLHVRQRPGADLFRSILHFSRDEISSPSTAELIIRNNEGGYTEEFVELMKDYYLYL
jgi:tRNA1Val (adenine37-N6)-methyltransferase